MVSCFAVLFFFYTDIESLLFDHSWLTLCKRSVIQLCELAVQKRLVALTFFSMLEINTYKILVLFDVIFLAEQV